MSIHKYLSPGASGQVNAGIIEFVFESTSKYPVEAVWRQIAREGIAAGKISHNVAK
jgi:hypothetical protein